MGFLVGELAQVVGRLLVDIVVEPVRVEQVGVGAPGDQGLLGGVVVGEVVARQGDGQALGLVALVLVLEGIGVVLRVPGDKDVLAVAGGGQVHPGLRGDGQDLQVRHGGDVLGAHLGMAGMGGR